MCFVTAVVGRRGQAGPVGGFCSSPFFLSGLALRKPSVLALMESGDV